jgi:energy-coupling factor transporter ATP-binding protein EcfA2
MNTTYATRPLPNVQAPLAATAPLETDADIMARLDLLAAEYGGRTRFIPANAIWTRDMVQMGRALTVALGLNETRAEALRERELWDFYITARKAPEGGRRLARKLNGHYVAPAPAPSATALAPMDPAALKELVDSLARNATTTAQGLIAEALATVPGLVQAEAEARLPRLIEIVDREAGTRALISNPHVDFEHVLAFAEAREDTFLVGPAGSGKTTIAQHVGEALVLEFYGEAKVEFASTLAGYKNITTGEYVRSNFREAYEFGGVFLLDECDSSSAGALLFINAALSNGWCLFPDGKVMRHPDFICICAGNTYGHGATRKYMGRTKLDGAFLNRFAVLTIQYDEALETILAGNKDWAKYVQAVRAVVLDNEFEAIVSPRATFKGSKMIGRGMSWDKVADAYIWQGMNAEDRRTVEASAPMARYETSIL